MRAPIVCIDLKLRTSPFPRRREAGGRDFQSAEGAHVQRRRRAIPGPRESPAPLGRLQSRLEAAGLDGEKSHQNSQVKMVGFP